MERKGKSTKTDAYNIHNNMATPLTLLFPLLSILTRKLDYVTWKDHRRLCGGGEWQITKQISRAHQK